MKKFAPIFPQLYLFRFHLSFLFGVFFGLAIIGLILFPFFLFLGLSLFPFVLFLGLSLFPTSNLDPTDANIFEIV